MMNSIGRVVTLMGVVASAAWSGTSLGQGLTTPNPQSGSELCLGVPLSSRGHDLNLRKYNDLRDLMRYDNVLSNTASHIIDRMEENPQRFLSQLRSGPDAIGNRATSAVYYRNGAQGPTDGKEVLKGDKKVYVATQDPAHTRKNSILGVEIEKINEIACNAAYDLRLVMFVHDDATGYFFRKIDLRMDWRDKGNVLQNLSYVSDVHLNDTDFKVYGDLTSRMVILHDEKHSIKKVMPIGLGAFDVQSEPSMVNELGAAKAGLTTYEFPDATLQKTATQNSIYANTRSRVYPSYYHARPFISLFDKEKGYRQIGMHYQITDDPVNKDNPNLDPVPGSGLIRGFISHGCIRVRDQDLYQLDAIVNEGPHEKVYAEFRHSLADLAQFEDILHVYPLTDNWYRIVTYKFGQSDDKIYCGNREYEVSKVGGYHTLADSECLTKMRNVNGSVYNIINYLRGTYTAPPRTDIADWNWTHYPLEGQAGTFQETPSSGLGGFASSKDIALNLMAEARENYWRLDALGYDCSVVANYPGSFSRARIDDCNRAAYDYEIQRKEVERLTGLGL